MATSAWRTRDARRPADRSDAAALMLAREATNAGSRPNSTPAASAVSAENVSARVSIAIGFQLRRSAGRSAARSGCEIHARPTPAAAPTTASSTLSVKSCRTTRSRLAPSADRIASSRLRDTPCVSSKPATFAHATSNSSATAPTIAVSTSVVLPTSASRAETTVTPHSLLDAG